MTGVTLLRQGAELPGGRAVQPRQEACLTGLVARMIHRPTREGETPVESVLVATKLHVPAPRSGPSGGRG